MQKVERDTVSWIFHRKVVLCTQIVILWIERASTCILNIYLCRKIGFQTLFTRFLHYFFLNCKHLTRRFRWNSKSIIDCCEKSPKFSQETTLNCIFDVFDCRWYVNGEYFWTWQTSIYHFYIRNYVTTGGYHKTVLCTKYLPAIRKHLSLSLPLTQTHFICFSILVVFATFTMVIPGEPFNINNTVDLYCWVNGRIWCAFEPPFLCDRRYSTTIKSKHP